MKNMEGHMKLKSDDPQYSVSETEIEVNLPDVGDQISFYLPLDDQLYDAKVASIDDNRFTINNVDGDIEERDLMQEDWKYQIMNVSANKQKAICNELKKLNETSILKIVADYFGNKQFMRHEAQGSEQYPLKMHIKQKNSNL